MVMAVYCPRGGFKIQNDNIKTDSKQNNLEGKTLTKLEGLTEITANTENKYDTEVNIEVDEKDTEPHKVPDCATSKRLRCTDKS